MISPLESEEMSFLYGGNSAFIEDLYDRYLADPESVDDSWRAYFGKLGEESEAFLRSKAARVPHRSDVSGSFARSAPAMTSLMDDQTQSVIRDHLRVIMLIRAYRVRGHLAARLDPLELSRRDKHLELDPSTYGFTEADYDREFFLDYVLGLEKATLREIMERLRSVYADTVGIEFLHIQDQAQKSWIQAKVEGGALSRSLEKAERVEILEQLTEAEGFEQFLDVKFKGTKRFGLDGGESAMPALETMIRVSADLGVEEVVIGMPHRGRLNVLANLMGKPYEAILAEFFGTNVGKDMFGSGDVKYHLGMSLDRELPTGKTVHLSLTANPSHLEAVDPVVCGKVRAKQAMNGDTDRSKTVGLLLHGDAAFAGQGVVHEVLEMCELRGFRTGGTLHLIVNNQIGFTTNPMNARSSPYPSDVARGSEMPIFHVNGDDPEAVVKVAQLAAEFRHLFKKDVIVDLWCYRRNGHNEGDEPSFTQPLMYRKIREHPTTRQLYSNALVDSQTLTRNEAEGVYDEFRKRLSEAFEAARNYRVNKLDWLEGTWEGLKRAPMQYERGQSGAPSDMLRDVGLSMTDIPESHHTHRRLKRIIAERRKSITTGEGIDWATAEHLAFGTLLREGFSVRLSGQDCGRGTFSQRHAVIYDQETEQRYIPLQHLHEDQASFEVVDSFLSEEGVLGFEYGYSLADPRSLVLWEAQFGDFANGAQVYFDQFISSGEAKWLRMSGLVCLLPHGYEGQGPEHSSARLERFLQLYAFDPSDNNGNIQVCYPSTPASYFHMLRRQVHRPFRKPLIVMTPKSLLRHKQCVSAFEEMSGPTTFHRVLWEEPPSDADRKIERVLMCSGKLYYELKNAREEMGLNDRVAIVRMEQIAPFPKDALMSELKRYDRSVDVMWVQEEPRNMGAWYFLAPRIEETLRDMEMQQRRAIFVGRDHASSPATGFFAQHAREQSAIIEEAFNL